MHLDNKSVARILHYFAEGLTLAAEIVDPQSARNKTRSSK